MALMNDVYSYIESNYQPNEPIFLSELSIPGMKAVSVRQQMKKLTESGQLKRFDTGIYYIPKKSMFRSGSTLSVDEVIRRKYLADGGNCCGYVGGILFANQLGLTTQVPGAYEIYTNKATTDYRETQLANLRVILRKPYCAIDEKNAETLQFLDLLKEIVDISEKIDTYETSIQPYEDCCTIFVAKHPVTKPNIEVIRRSEEKLAEKIDAMVQEAIDTVEVIEVTP